MSSSISAKIRPVPSRAVLAAMLCAATPAMAQRTDNNAVTAAQDAFGSSVGDEKIGLYNSEDVRGFSPVAAGNVRIEGLYFDQQSHVTDRLLAGTTVRVGLSAQGYPFPAPTGIADYELRKAGEQRVISVGTTWGPFGGKVGELDMEFPLIGTKLGLTAGAGIFREGQPHGSSSAMESVGVSLRYAPAPGMSLQPFYSQINIRSDEVSSLIFTRQDALPDRIPRANFFGQKWADFEGTIKNYGAVGKARLAGFDAALGVFRSQLAVDQDFADLLLDTEADGRVGKRLIYADRNNFFGSTSGEFRLSRSFEDGARRHILHGTLKGRQLSRRYGGTDVLDLGASFSNREDFRPEIPFVTGAKTRDRVTQKTWGLGYELRWAKLGELGASIQKSDYSKRVTDPTGRIARSEDNPWLYSLTGAIHLAAPLVLYGGLVRGLEESDTAPLEAVNSNAAPPAIRTRQKDFGLRWAIKPGLSAVLGWFDISKPYYALDQARLFRQLGAVRKRGVEFSLSGKIAPGLTVVTGGLYNKAQISGEEVEAGLIGDRPSGTARLRLSTNLNWEVPWHTPLTLTGQVVTFTRWAANAENTVFVPGRSVVHLGARYRFDVGDTHWLVRGKVENIFNTFGWAASGSGYINANPPRRYSLSLAVDL
ncbi:MAG TPA: TonB-dependent receptor [Chakrabartia sp.]|nr:TonB-dependent receptor [Chakrabartia sp.]